MALPCRVLFECGTDLPEVIESVAVAAASECHDEEEAEHEIEIQRVDLRATRWQHEGKTGSQETQSMLTKKGNR